ncbi:hypothetical protein K9N68_02925 [Kovacikia minuta CCNUW1]|uniref:hypothetical protein n=1 Tax=Kovacikia minuta TaxID=2931930 RepID=UPI001CCAC8DA|nr:hypothetical protein [Kovacikia minuta]UBF26955.1 hypothetical protein K9N68_02925 [Kovacikia minuta CCNUW1]
MKRVLNYQRVRLIQIYGKAAFASALLLGGLTFLKLAPMTKAGLPEVMAGGELKKLQATATARVAQRQEQLRQVRPEHYDLGRFPITNKNEKHWRNILWTTAVVEPQQPFVAEALDQILSMMTASGLSDSQMRTVDTAAKVGTQLYLKYPDLYTSVRDRFLQAVDQSRDPEWVALALSGLEKSGMPLDQMQVLAERVKARFPNWSNNVYLYTTIRDVADAIAPSPTPPLEDLLNWKIAPRQLHLYALCQPDRDVLCQTVLKDRDGEFVRRQDGQLWSMPLLLRTIHHGLGWNFVRGQTPQGVYRVEGIEPQPDDEYFRAYGQFSLVKLFVPFESGAKQFLPGKPGSFVGNLTAYQNLLPPSWRNYWPIQESYWAGKVGRSEFRIHGTGESPDFFSSKSKEPEAYNWNPTIGCLSALELYNEKGQLLQADMPKLLKALRIIGGSNFTGYLIVVDLPGKPGQSIALNQIDTAIGNSKSKSLDRAKSLKQSTPKSQHANKKKSGNVALASNSLTISPDPNAKFSPISAASSPNLSGIVDFTPPGTEQPKEIKPQTPPHPIPLSY